jgi:hypothetical protein
MCEDGGGGLFGGPVWEGGKGAVGGGEVYLVVDVGRGNLLLLIREVLLPGEGAAAAVGVWV